MFKWHFVCLQAWLLSLLLWSLAPVKDKVSQCSPDMCGTQFTPGWPLTSRLKQYFLSLKCLDYGYLLPCLTKFGVLSLFLKGCYTGQVGPELLCSQGWTSYSPECCDYWHIIYYHTRFYALLMMKLRAYWMPDKHFTKRVRHRFQNHRDFEGVCLPLPQTRGDTILQ